MWLDEQYNCLDFKRSVYSQVHSTYIVTLTLSWYASLYTALLKFISIITTKYLTFLKKIFGSVVNTCSVRGVFYTCNAGLALLVAI